MEVEQRAFSSWTAPSSHKEVEQIRGLGSALASCLTTLEPAETECEGRKPCSWHPYRQPHVSPMPRRSHKKSRAGCSECKRRHLKCDETKPKCINCVTAHLRCPYEDEPRLVSDYVPSPSQEPVRETTTSTASTPSRSPTSTTTILSHAQTPGDTALNLLHLELLYHWSNDLCRMFWFSTDGPYQTYSDTCVKQGLRHPFLMRQILATSALHISITRPDRRAIYRQHATQLQAEALADFNPTLHALDENNVVAAFLVSSLIGMHVFCETFLFREGTNPSFTSTLDSLIGCINLLQGVRSVIDSWWEFLCTTELGPIVSLDLERQQGPTKTPVDLGDLNRMIDSADVGAVSREAYKRAVVELETIFAAQTNLQELEANVQANMLFSWLVIVPREYVDLLSARRPEALVILAYYAINLHYRRKFWAINGAGEYLIQGISAHLGKHWDQWLAWPRQVITA